MAVVDSGLWALHRGQRECACVPKRQARAAVGSIKVFIEPSSQVLTPDGIILNSDCRQKTTTKTFGSWPPLAKVESRSLDATHCADALRGYDSHRCNAEVEA